MKTISINGRDRSGKSQQVRLLGWRTGEIIHITKPLVSYSTKWPNLNGYKMSQWWFEKVPFEDLTDIIIESINNRHRDRIQDKISVYDRGWRMFKAVCIATKITREDVSLGEAMEFVEHKFAKGLDHTPEEAEFLFEQDREYFLRIDRLVELLRPSKDPSFPESANQRYARYQRNLATAVNICFGDPQIHRIRICEPILGIQNKLRILVSELGGVILPRLGESIELAVGLGGLSESGKSSFAEHLRQNYSFLRTKLKYFIGMIEYHGLVRTPERIVLELLHFLECHPYIRRVSFESLHDPYIPATIKLMLGDRCKIVFLETREDVRISRGAKELNVSTDEAARIIAQKDQTKRGRGAEKVKSIADIVFDNSTDDHRQNLQKITKMLNL